MPIRVLLDEAAFTPEEATALVGAFEATLVALGLTSREDPMTTLVAEKVMDLARRGERDPLRIQSAVLAQVRL